MMRRQGGGFPAVVLVAVAMGCFGFIVWKNAQPVPAVRTIIPTEQQPTADSGGWAAILRAGFGSDSTPLPTIAPLLTPFVPPTLAISGDTNLIPIPPVEVSGSDLNPTLNAIVTPTRPAPTPLPAATDDLSITAQSVTRPPSVWQPPPLMPPISRDPLGRDHYWFSRPVDSNATNFALFSYPYGSRGPEDTNPWRVHNGIDMPNPIGQTVRAAGSGTIMWAGSGFQNTSSYGNAILIQHDFGYRGQSLYTLYAHLSAVMVAQGQMVNAGDPIGLVGNTGRVSGPHVHFEVRLGGDRYGNTYNPLLWMVPYVAHGVIAGRLVDGRGNLLEDQTVTVRDWRTGLITDSITTYIYEDTPSDVNADPLWQENFVVADVPVGRYEVVANIDGLRVSKIIDVAEGTTSFVELTPVEPATPQTP
ncbi:MAG TPA: peptidoglycan DD-metalloendopeptidase family protein [Phototrophicaceae bacterium]|nr:peptidoglycan DD-metalloendopeptidase family protein [Phototrophicaceae bacterium]